MRRQRRPVAGHPFRKGWVPAAFLMIVATAACAQEVSPSYAPTSSGAAVISPDASFPSITSPDIPPSFPPLDASATPVAGDFPACDLLQASELGAVIGDGTATAMPAGGWTAGQCAWSGADASFFLSVGTAESIAAFGDADEPDADAKLEAYRDANAGQLVDDIGDDAFLSEAGLALRHGGIYVEVTRLRMTDDQLISLAASISEDLGR